MSENLREETDLDAKVTKPASEVREIENKSTVLLTSEAITGAGNISQSVDTDNGLSFTVVTKDGGNLTKTITVGEDGELVKNSSDCMMYAGTGHRRDNVGLDAFAGILAGLEPSQAILYGVYDGETVSIVTKKKKAAMKLARANTDVRSRSKDEPTLNPPAGQALFLIDYDPDDRDPSKLDSHEDIHALLAEVEPAFSSAGYVATHGTSSHISLNGERKDVGGSAHLYYAVSDGMQVKALSDRLETLMWLKGHGYIKISKSGARLYRTFIDHAVHSYERLIFEAGAVYEGEGLEQDRPPAQYVPGSSVVVADLAPLTAQQDGQAAALKMQAYDDALDAAKARQQIWLEDRAAVIADRDGISFEAAKKIAREEVVGGVLSGKTQVKLDSGKVVTVDKILSDPAAYHGETCYDPLEPLVPNKAIIYSDRPRPTIRSYARGGVTYSLKMSLAGVMEKVETLDSDDSGAGVEDILRLTITGGMTALETDRVLKAIKDATDFGIVSLRGTLKVLTRDVHGDDEDNDDRPVPAYVNELNSRFFTCLQGNVYLWQESPNAKGHVNLQHVTQSAFLGPYMNRPCGEGTVATEWLKHPKRRGYDLMGLWPEEGACPPNAYNKWQGFGVPATPGDWTMFKDFTRDIICAGDEKAFDYVYKALAWKVQNPAKLPGVCIALRSEREGTGKGKFTEIYGHLFGGHVEKINDAEHIVGSFNYPLDGALILILDEAIFAPSKSHRDKLYSIITEKTVSINSKGLNQYQTDNMAMVFLTSNKEGFIPAGERGRRFCALEVSMEREQDSEFFGELEDLMINRGGCSAMLHELLHVDLTGFDVRAFPMTQALVEQRRMSAESATTRWIIECLDAGELLGRYGSESARPWDVQNISKEDLHKFHVGWCERQRFHTKADAKNAFFKKLNELDVIAEERKLMEPAPPVNGVLAHKTPAGAVDPDLEKIQQAERERKRYVILRPLSVAEDKLNQHLSTVRGRRPGVSKLRPS